MITLITVLRLLFQLVLFCLLSKMDRWVGKVAVVTGASAGIGAAIVEELVKSGMKVVGIARRVERIEEIKEKLKNEKGELFPLKGDIGKAEDIDKIFELIKSQFGTVHALVNNAGIGRPGLIIDGNLEDFNDIINVNLLGPINLAQKTLQLMKTSDVTDGHIININSVAGHYIPQIDGFHMTVYAASKHGLRGLTEGIRHELRTLKLNTKITSISPGAVDTEIGQASLDGTKGPQSEPPPEVAEALKSLSKLSSKDVADAVVYVLQTPPHVQVHELMIRPVGEPY